MLSLILRQCHKNSSQQRRNCRCSHIESAGIPPPDLIIIGSGIGAVLTPIIENGFLRDINVISGGFDLPSRNFVNIEPSGQDANLNPIVKSWVSIF